MSEDKTQGRNFSHNEVQNAKLLVVMITLQTMKEYYILYLFVVYEIKWNNTDYLT